MKKIYVCLLFACACNISNLFAQHTEVLHEMAKEDLPNLTVRYYFYPNLDAYFDTKQNVYLYQEKGQWVKNKKIASGYRGYSMFNNLKVEITDYYDEVPYTLLAEHQKKFPKQYANKRKPPVPTTAKESNIVFR